MKYRSSNFIWGTVLLLAAALVLVNQLDGFANIGTGSIIAAILAVVFLVQCIVDLHFAPLPIPLAVLYVIFQSPLGLPYIKTWPLIVASALAAIGLSILFPHRHWRIKDSRDGRRKYRHYRQTNSGGGSNDNNPSVSVQFNSVSRHVQADGLETTQLYCRFGALEIFFDQAQLSPRGAEIILDCRFGAITLFVPKDWQLIDRLNCTLGGVDIDRRFAAPAENAPQLTLSGSVSLGGIEVRYI